jgi:hypothetical protein
MRTRPACGRCFTQVDSRGRCSIAIHTENWRLYGASIVPCLRAGICMLLDVEARARVKITFLRWLAGDDMVRQARAFDLSKNLSKRPMQSRPTSDLPIPR